MLDVTISTRLMMKSKKKTRKSKKYRERTVQHRLEKDNL